MKFFRHWRKDRTMNEYKLYDSADKYYDQALVNYGRTNKKDKNTLTDEDYREANRWAGLHIAMFMTWIIRRRFESGIFSEIDGAQAALEDLRAERITGSDFLEKFCEGKLQGKHLSDDITPFVDAFYGEYLEPFYTEWVLDCIFDVPFEFGWSWEEYHKLEELLDERYNEYLENAKHEEEKREKQAEKQEQNNGGLFKKLFSGFGKK